MRVLMTVHGYPPECRGGTETYLPRLVAELCKRGHALAVVSGSHEGRAETTVDQSFHEGVPVFKIHRRDLYVDHWGKSYAPDVESAFREILDAWKPDLVHVHHWLRLTRTMVACAHGRGIPAIVTLHDLWSTCPRVFRVREEGYCERLPGGASCLGCAPELGEATEIEESRALDEYFADLREELRLARRLTVPTETHRLEIQRFLPRLREDIEVVRFATVSEIKKAVVHEPDPEGRLRLVHFGHLSRLKGTDVLLRAVTLLPEAARRRMRMTVLGAMVYPEERPELERLAELAGVKLAGAFTYEDLAAHQADVAVFPSRCAETHSVVLDEAFALGWPAIVPNRGALSERVGLAGACFRPEDPTDLARVISACIEDPSLVHQWRGAIPPAVPFSMHADRMEESYRDVLADQEPLRKPTPQAMLRRAAFLVQRLESLGRRLEHLRGALRNAQNDISRQNATLEVMDHSHREKDKVIASLEARIQKLEAERSASNP